MSNIDDESRGHIISFNKEYVDYLNKLLSEAVEIENEVNSIDSSNFDEAKMKEHQDRKKMIGDHVEDVKNKIKEIQNVVDTHEEILNK